MKVLWDIQNMPCTSQNSSFQPKRLPKETAPGRFFRKAFYLNRISPQKKNLKTTCFSGPGRPPAPSLALATSGSGSLESSKNSAFFANGIIFSAQVQVQTFSSFSIFKNGTPFPFDLPFSLPGTLLFGPATKCSRASAVH